ncbi:MAG: hypothetical protein H0T75_12710 [Rhizobiales bacterium]|jgi:hypothetical protein|nr:hypothetical protein [Hyphomicrobiales bacterium]
MITARLQRWWVGRHTPPGLTRRSAAVILLFGLIVLLFAALPTITPGGSLFLNISGILLLVGGVANLLPSRFHRLTNGVNTLFYLVTPPLIVIWILVSLV